jgi:delta 1-pyrroline-5-carboxylate dehydrogenase
MDNVIASKEIQVERKRLVIEFRENPRGRFLRIIEEAHGRRNAVIVPSTGLAEFLTSVADVLVQAGESAPATPAI